MKTWNVTKNFDMIADLNREALSYLTKQSIRTTGEPDCYVYTTVVEADTAQMAGIIANQLLLSIVARYRVLAHVSDTKVEPVES